MKNILLLIFILITFSCFSQGTVKPKLTGVFVVDSTDQIFTQKVVAPALIIDYEKKTLYLLNTTANKNTTLEEILETPSNISLIQDSISESYVGKIATDTIILGYDGEFYDTPYYIKMDTSIYHTAPNLYIGISDLMDDVENRPYGNIIVGSDNMNYAGYEEMTALNISIGNEVAVQDTIGNANTIIGHYAFRNAGNNGAGDYCWDNVAIGNSSMYYMQGFKNTAVGFSSMCNSYDSKWNVGIGNATLAGKGGGLRNFNFNTAVGSRANDTITTGTYNCAFGYRSLGLSEDASRNISIGAFSGFSNVSGNSNIFIGDSAGYNETNSNKLYIHNNASTSPLIYGDFSTRDITIYGNLGIGTTNAASSLMLYEPVANGTNYTAFKSQAQAGNITYTLPAADGSSGTSLITNGSGTLSWSGYPADDKIYSFNVLIDTATVKTLGTAYLIVAAPDAGYGISCFNVVMSTTILKTRLEAGSQTLNLWALSVASPQYTFSNGIIESPASTAWEGTKAASAYSKSAGALYLQFSGSANPSPNGSATIRISGLYRIVQL